MATGQTIIDEATRLLRVRGNTSFVTQDSVRNAELFLTLQNLISEWGEDNKLRIPPPALVSDALDIAPGSIRALEYNLAAFAGPSFGRNDIVVAEVAKETRDRLSGQSTLDMSVDMSDLSFTYKYNIESDR